MKNIARKKVLFLILISALINVLLFPATGLAGEKITIDDGDPEFSTKGPWADSDFMGGYDYDSVRLWSLSGGTATYRPDLPRDGSYEVSGHWPSWGQFSNVPYVIHHKDGKTTVRANQKIDVYKFVSLGNSAFYFSGLS